MTAISLLAIKVDSEPEEVRLNPDLLLRLEAGVHLDLASASEETLTAIGRCFFQAARTKASTSLRAVS